MHVLSTDTSSMSLVRAWACSLTVHGFAIAVALWFVSEIRPVIPKEPFRWQVAFVEPPPPEPVQQVQAPQPTSQPSPTRPQPVTPPIESKPIIETRSTPQAVQSRTVQAVERMSVQPVTREVQTTRAEPPTEKGAAQPVERTVRHADEVATQTEPAAAERAVVARERTAAVSSAPTAAETLRPAPVQEARSQPEIAKPAEAPPSPPMASAPETSPVQAPATQSLAVHTSPTARADYGWLKDLLARKIKEVKRYPHTARLNRWEGKVVVHVVINEDGNLADVRVHESSGHATLDEDALETMRKACPLHMSHPLGRPQMAIRVPISYSLND